MEEVHAQFTEHVVAEKDVDCDRYLCDSNGGIIPAGQRRFYIYPKLDKSGIAHGPGKWVCKKCYIYYRSQKDTVIWNIPAITASQSTVPVHSTMVPDINSIRQSVNESQRQGKFF